MTSSVGFLALARTTFDVDLANQISKSALETLRSAVSGVIGDASPVVDVNTARSRTTALAESGIGALYVLQATFADSTLIAAVAQIVECPIVLWAVPEERTGERLRLNSLCGINLAGYALARDGVDYRWVYRHPDDKQTVADLEAALHHPPHGINRPTESDGLLEPLQTIAPPTLDGSVVGLVGRRPDGFEPCDYNAEQLFSLTGVSVDVIDLPALFEAGNQASTNAVAGLRGKLADTMTGLDDVDQTALDRSLRIHLGLADLVERRDWDGVAVRCWPECFTEFGGAACAGMALLTSDGTPGCCEADVYGNVTALLLQQLSGQAPFIADLVDLDRVSNTGVFWHCGLATHEMAQSGDMPRATIHSNRNKPLLSEFSLRPGRITLARLSQSRGKHSLVVGGAEMLHEPLPFSGTSGVARFDSDVAGVLDTIMANGLEHHYGIAYGDHRDGLRAYAAHIGVPVIDL